MSGRLARVRPGLWQLTLASYVNCFLVQEDDGLTLVDTGLPTSAAAILAAADQLGSPLARVLLTHTHRDHAGGLDALLRRAPGTALWLTQRAASALDDRFAPRPGDAGPPVRRFLFSRARSRPAGTLRAGDQIGRLLLLEAPGHSPDHVAYYLTGERALIAGDAFTIRRGALRMVGQPRNARSLGEVVANLTTRLVTWHLPTATRTAARLRDLQPDLLLVGHGPPLERPLEQLNRALKSGEDTLGAQGGGGSR